MKKSGKKYKQKEVGNVRSIRLLSMQSDFNEIETVFRQLRLGNVLEAKDPKTGNWVMVYKRPDGTLCYFMKAAQEWVQLFHELAKYYLPSYDDQPMRKLLSKLNIGQ